MSFAWQLQCYLFFVALATGFPLCVSEQWEAESKIIRRKWCFQSCQSRAGALQCSLLTPMQWLSRDGQPSSHSIHRGLRRHRFCIVLIIAATDLPVNAVILALHRSENPAQLSISNPVCFWGRNDTFKCIQKPGLWPKEIVHPFISPLPFCSCFIIAQFSQISSIFIYMHFLAPKVTEVIKARPVMSAASTDMLEFKQDNSRTEHLGSHSLS